MYTAPFVAHLKLLENAAVLTSCKARGMNLQYRYLIDKPHIYFKVATYQKQNQMFSSIVWQFVYTLQFLWTGCILRPPNSHHLLLVWHLTFHHTTHVTSKTRWNHLQHLQYFISLYLTFMKQRSLWHMWEENPEATVTKMHVHVLRGILFMWCESAWNISSQNQLWNTVFAVSISKQQ